MIQVQMRILYLNANSMFNELTEIMVLSTAKDIQVICITETWLCCDILDAEVQIKKTSISRKQVVYFSHI